MILVNYLAETGRDSGIHAAMTISVPWKWEELISSLKKPMNSVYNKFMLKMSMNSFIR